MKKFFRGKRLAQFQSKYKKIASMIAVIVVFATTYALILPAITLDSNRASQEAGVEIAEPNTSVSSLPSIEEAFVPSDLNNAEESVRPETEVKSGRDVKAETEARSSAETVPAAENQEDEESDLITETEILTASHKNYKVTAEVTADAKLPKDVKFKVKEIGEGTSDYQVHYQKAQEALNGKEISDIRFYDISFESDGQEVQPQADVKISISPTKSILAQEEDLFVLHFLDDGRTEELVITDSEEKGDRVTEVSFESSAFSPFATGATAKEEKDEAGSPERAVSHTVNFVYTDNNGDQIEIASSEIESGQAITTLPDNPFREGYRFEGWINQDTGERVTTDTVVTTDMTVVGQFSEIKIYTITVKYYYYNNHSSANTVFETEIFQIEDLDTPYRITPPPSTKPEEDLTMPPDAIYYPKQSIIDIADGDQLESMDAADGTEDKQITYELEFVPYTAVYNVHYMLKNLTGNGYSEIETVVNYGILNSTVRPQVLTYSYATFESTNEVEITQAEDQDLYVHYTRNSYTLSYNTNGGSYVTWQDGLYGSQVPVTSTVPTKRGYTFDGWYDNPELSGSPVTGNVTLNQDVTLYAKWKANNVNYLVAYYREVYDNSTNTTYYVYDSSRNATGQVGTTVQATSAPGMSSVPLGYERESAYGKNANSSVVIDADGQSVLKVYYSLIRYNFIFNLNGPYAGSNNNYSGTLTGGQINIGGQSYNNSNYRIANVVLGQDISSVWPSGSQVTRTTNTNYRFAGWNNPYNTYGTTSSRVLYVTKRFEVTTDLIRGADTNTNEKVYQAFWRTNLTNYAVQYWLQDADNPSSYTKSTYYSEDLYLSGNLSGKELAGFTIGSSTPNGYRSSGNTNDNGGYSSTYHYRFYYTRNSYNIDYYYGSNKLNTISNVLFDANINTPSYNYTPNRPSGVDNDYTWGGWYTDANLTEAYTFNKMPSNNLALYAKWIAPSFTVDFNLNGGEGAAPDTQTVEKYDFAEAPADPTREHYNFIGWYTAADGGERYDWAKPVTENITLYARWALKPLAYTVKYVDADNHDTRLAADKIITSPALAIDQTITEKALAITGYRPDNSSKSIDLDFTDNIITFYYTKKAAQVSYTIEYLEEGTNNPLKDPVTKVADGSTIVAKENAADVGPDYYPLNDTLSLTLSSNSANNIITFYYTTFDTGRITVNYLDMDGNPIPGQAPLTETRKKPSTYKVQRPAIAGYSYHSAEDVSDPANPVNVLATYRVNGGEQIVVNLYYQKDLTIEALNKEKVYDGTALTSNDLTDLKDTYKDLLEAGDVLTDITFTGSQTDVGSSATTPSAAIIEAATGNDRTYYYKINYLAGSLTVTPLNVTVAIDGQNLTKTYDGTYSTITYDITSISDSLYLEDYINFNGADADKSISQKDAGTYDLTIDNRFTNTNDNFNVQFNVSNGQLTINKRTVELTSADAEKAFDGSALTANTVTASAQTVDEGFILGEGVASYDVTGNQTEPGSSENTFTYTLNSNTNSQNYDITTNFGTLLVTPTVNIQKTKTDWTALSGGTFELSKLVDGAWTAIDGVGTLSSTSDAGVNIPVGLRAGSYRVKETSAPDGYVVLDSYVYFTITESTDSNGQLTFNLALSAESADKARLTGAGDTYSNRIQIANQAGKALPSTGGSGKLAFTLAGLGLMLLALLSRAVMKPRLERSDESS